MALNDLLSPGTLWFGWSGRLAAKPAPHAAILEARGVTYATLDLTGEQHRGYYVGFANGALWPLLHFRLDLMHFRREDYNSYLDVNCTFAEALYEHLASDDTVWAHDYHLIPFARLLRGRDLRARSGFSCIFRSCHPRCWKPCRSVTRSSRIFAPTMCWAFRPKSMRGTSATVRNRLLGATVNGEYVRLDGHAVRAFVNPIGIDAAGFAADAERAKSDKAVTRLAASITGRALAIGVDRMDYSKGLPNRFLGYARLLERHPEHLRKVHLLQICPRSREEVDEYRKLRAELDQLTGRINGRHSEFDWTPLRYSTRAAPRGTLAGIYRIARLGVVTPLRDGMNLVAKEFVAAQPDDDPGVLILSQFAGAAQELEEALIVNPLIPTRSRMPCMPPW